MGALNKALQTKPLIRIWVGASEFTLFKANTKGDELVTGGRDWRSYSFCGLRFEHLWETKKV